MHDPPLAGIACPAGSRTLPTKKEVHLALARQAINVKLTHVLHYPGCSCSEKLRHYPWPIANSVS